MIKSVSTESCRHVLSKQDCIDRFAHEIDDLFDDYMLDLLLKGRCSGPDSTEVGSRPLGMQKISHYALPLTEYITITLLHSVSTILYITYHIYGRIFAHTLCNANQT